MARVHGRFISGSPLIPFTLGGSRTRLEFEGIVDSGVTGFLLLPIGMAVPLGLELDGLIGFVLADGSLQQRLSASATVELGTRAVDKSIALEYYGSEVWLGIEFLETFNQSLIIRRDQVLLVDNSDLDPLLDSLH